MKSKIIFILLGIFYSTYSQSIYEVQPGTKGNQIIISLANISVEANAENVEVRLLHFQNQNIIFLKESQVIKTINPGKEDEVVFNFDIRREAPVNKEDTIEFIITDNKTIFTTKQFILSYTPPKEYKLEQNYPNPFNPSTTIQYQLPTDSKVTLKVYDILGSEVTTLVNEIQTAGYREIKFNASHLSSGVYIYRLTAGNYVSTKKMMVVK